MPHEVALITALILERPTCRVCIAEKSGLRADDVDRPLTTIRRVLELRSTVEQCRSCGAETDVLSIDRP
jgi:hypothetical protein